ncbi:hypothetical protein E2C01_013248 [Portunus trituberculatus]|uniref:Uncharacterized protein n=1 Tax=Portunus trituberculatus TaxID=210409 RepID=A0A5B7DG55_PORTR|nr:hypothetical protein [Portunus trituberculatus]
MASWHPGYRHVCVLRLILEAAGAAERQCSLVTSSRYRHFPRLGLRPKHVRRFRQELPVNEANQEAHARLRRLTQLLAFLRGA